MSAASTGPLTAAQRADLRTVQLPDRLNIRGLDRRPDFERYVNRLVADWAASGRISEPKAGFGFATSRVVPLRALMEADLEDPSSYITAAFTSGDVPPRYMWNAVRKLYELLRLIQEGHDLSGTLDAVQNRPELLRLAGLSENPDHTIPWVPFSYGGAVILRAEARSAAGGAVVPMAVISAFSVWTQVEDDAVAAEAAKWQLRLSL